MDKLSYALGHNIGRQLLGLGMNGDFSAADFAAAVADVLSGAKPQVEEKEIERVLGEFFSGVEERQRAAAAQAGAKAKEAGERFLAENGKREGVHTTASGLQYEVLSEGTGRQPRATDTVRCHYHGTLTDGSVFDSSYERGNPLDFNLQQVISGWTEGVQLMKEGAKYRFYIPYHLGYGEQGAGGAIPPYAALVFDVELLKVL